MTYLPLLILLLLVLVVAIYTQYSQKKILYDIARVGSRIDINKCKDKQMVSINDYLNTNNIEPETTYKFTLPGERPLIFVIGKTQYVTQGRFGPISGASSTYIVFGDDKSFRDMHNGGRCVTSLCESWNNLCVFKVRSLKNFQAWLVNNAGKQK